MYGLRFQAEGVGPIEEGIEIKMKLQGCREFPRCLCCYEVSADAHGHSQVVALSAPSRKLESCAQAPASGALGNRKVLGKDLKHICNFSQLVSTQS